MTFRTPSLALLLAAVAWVPRTAQAEPNPAEISDAKHAFESALTAEAESRWADAAQKLREAIAVKDTPGLRFHLAHCETELGHLVAALAEYDRAQELLRQGVKAPDVQKLLGPARAEVLQKLPRLTLELPTDVQVPLIAIDQRPYPASELALGVPLDPGPHELRVQAAGRRPFERALDLKEGDRITLPVVMAVAAPPGGPSDAPAAKGPVQVSVGSAPVAPGDQRRASPAKLYLMIGESVLTAAGLGVGIGFAVAKGSATERIDSAQARIDSGAPGNPAACSMPEGEVAYACDDLTTALADHERASNLSTVGFVTAGVGAAALLTTWIFYPSPRARAAGLSMTPVAGLGRVGVVGRF
ncbi:MAG TPA: hypothetical protein VER96_08935 [Polyangiaceae bacterium]|nr:hypothetical protein [Polyangiaceae bacterium]